MELNHSCSNFTWFPRYFESRIRTIIGRFPDNPKTAIAHQTLRRVTDQAMIGITPAKPITTARNETNCAFPDDIS